MKVSRTQVLAGVGFVALMVFIFVVYEPDSDPAPAPVYPTPVVLVAPPHVPATPVQPDAPLPPVAPTPTDNTAVEAISAQATQAAQAHGTAIAQLQGALSTALAAVEAPTPSTLIVPEVLTDEQLDRWMCLERVSGTGRDTPQKIVGVEIVHEGVYWHAFDCNRFVEGE